MRCVACNLERPTRFGAFDSNIGMLVARIQRRSEGFFCERCYRDTFWKHQSVNLTLGWWGAISFFATTVLIPSNAFSYVRGKRPTLIGEDVALESEEATRASNRGQWTKSRAQSFGFGVIVGLAGLGCFVVVAALPKAKSSQEESTRWMLWLCAGVAAALTAWLMWKAFGTAGGARPQARQSGPRRHR
jgi:hypothetical protein